MLTTEEVYFLVRVGSWDQQQLEQWVQQRIQEDQDWMKEPYEQEEWWDERDE